MPKKKNTRQQSEPTPVSRLDDIMSITLGVSITRCQASTVRIWLLVTKDASSPRLCTKTLLRYPLITKKNLYQMEK